MQISVHARTRMQERLPNYGLNTKPMRVFKDALIYGKGVKDFYGEFHNYLAVIANRYEKTNLKVHNDIIFIYEVGKQKLVTVWNIPKEFEPYKRYLNCNRNEYESIIEEEKRKRDEDQLNIMSLESIIQSRPKNIVRGKGRCTDVNTNNYDARLFEIGYKECRNCGEVKRLEAFAPRKQSKDGRQPYCNECINEKNKARMKTSTVEELFTCSSCKIMKPISEFEKGRGRYGHSSICNSCKKMTAPETKVDSIEVSTNDTYNIVSINQAIRFSDRLKEKGISDKEFINFMKGSNTMYDMLEIYKHLSPESQNLYLRMRGE